MENVGLKDLQFYNKQKNIKGENNDGRAKENLSELQKEKEQEMHSLLLTNTLQGRSFVINLK